MLNRLLEKMARCSPFFGSEQALVENSVYRRILYATLGDLHFGRRWRDRVLSALLAHLCTPRRILDAGCGTGQTMAAIHRRYPSSIVDGCDIVRANVRKCARLARRTGIHSDRIWTCDMELEAPGNGYDLILCMDVLEHIEEWQRAARSLAEALSPDGILLITTPAAGPYQAANYALRRFNPDQADDRQGKGQSHARDGFTLAELRTGLEAAGLEICLGKHAFGPVAMWWHTAFEKLRSHIMPLWALVTLPALCVTGLFEPCLANDGGAIALLVRKAA